MSRLVQHFTFPGSVQQFRACMLRVINRLGAQGWYASGGQRLVLGEYPFMTGIYSVPANHDYYGHGTFSAFVWKPDADEMANSASATRPATRASFQVLPWTRSSMRPVWNNEGILTGGIEAYEERRDRTSVELLDGYDPAEPLRACPEIGAAFDEFAQWLINELQEDGDEILAENIVTVLFLAASPTDRDRLRVEEEIREIDSSLRASELRDRFVIEQCWAVRASDFQTSLLRYRPNIVHFSGHGTEIGELIVEDDLGDGRPINPVGLGRLFGILSDHIECVVLSACHSTRQGQEIIKHVDYVVSMASGISDLSAVIFSRAFYEALGYGRDVETAYKLGSTAILIHGQSDSDVPVLLKRTE